MVYGKMLMDLSGFLRTPESSFTLMRLRACCSRYLPWHSNHKGRVVLLFLLLDDISWHPNLRPLLHSLSFDFWKSYLAASVLSFYSQVQGKWSLAVWQHWDSCRRVGCEVCLHVKKCQSKYCFLFAFPDTCAKKQCRRSSTVQHWSARLTGYCWINRGISRTWHPYSSQKLRTFRTILPSLTFFG